MVGKHSCWLFCNVEIFQKKTLNTNKVISDLQLKLLFAQSPETDGLILWQAKSSLPLRRPLGSHTRYAGESEVVNQQACLEGKESPKDEPNRKLTGTMQSKSNYATTNYNKQHLWWRLFLSWNTNSIFKQDKSPFGESATTTQILTNILRQLFFPKYNQKYLLTKTHTALNCSMGQIYGIWKTLKYSLSLWK